SEPGTPDGRQDAGVLILLDGTPQEYRVFLCIRSDEMRRHPGEVCFPGGMRDADENLQETAIREAEEVGQTLKRKQIIQIRLYWVFHLHTFHLT
ncbi:Nudix hydrolase domain-containing protein, partial [Trichostrongylus colubriformis]